MSHVSTLNAEMIRQIDHFVQVLLDVSHGARLIEIDVFDDASDDAVDDVIAKRRHDFDDEDLTQRQIFFLNFCRKFLRTGASVVVVLVEEEV